MGSCSFGIDLWLLVDFLILILFFVVNISTLLHVADTSTIKEMVELCDRYSDISIFVKIRRKN